MLVFCSMDEMTVAPLVVFRPLHLSKTFEEGRKLYLVLKVGFFYVVPTGASSFCYQKKKDIYKPFGCSADVMGRNV